MAQQQIGLSEIQAKIKSAYPTYQAFHADYEPKRLLVQFDKVNTVQESISKKRMTVGDLAIIYPDPKSNNSVRYIIDWIQFINRTVNVNKPLTEIDPVAYMIYKDHKSMSLSDFKIIAERIMRGDYGMFYGSVDAQLILSAFVKYRLEIKAIQSKKQLNDSEAKPGEIKNRTELEIKIDEVTKNGMKEVNRLMVEEFNKLPVLQSMEKRSFLMQKLIHDEVLRVTKEYESNKTPHPVSQ